MNDVSKSQNQLEKLYVIKCQKLKEQKSISDQASAILDELNKSNAKLRKNLTAAIAVSKQPGYFDYYEPPPNVLSYEKNCVLMKLSSQISVLNKEIESITKEIDELELRYKSNPENTFKPSVGNLSQWFDVYGKPKPTSETTSKKTVFSPSTKIYGGTNYYKSFKSAAMTMQRGRLTK